MADNLKFLFACMLLAAGVLALGWKQPLRYRFMTTQEIAALENPPPPQPTPATAWMWDPSRSTKLDRGAYGERDYTSEGRGRRMPFGR